LYCSNTEQLTAALLKLHLLILKLQHHENTHVDQNPKKDVYEIPYMHPQHINALFYELWITRETGVITRITNNSVLSTENIELSSE